MSESQRPPEAGRPGPEPDTTDAAEPDDTDSRLEPEDAAVPDGDDPVDIDEIPA